MVSKIKAVVQNINNDGKCQSLGFYPDTCELTLCFLRHRKKREIHNVVNRNWGAHIMPEHSEYNPLTEGDNYLIKQTEKTCFKNYL